MMEYLYIFLGNLKESHLRSLDEIKSRNADIGSNINIH